MDCKLESGQFRYRPYTCSIQGTFEETMNEVETNLEFASLSKRDKTNRIILHHSGVSVLQSVEVIHNYHKNTNKIKSNI